jgi:L-iditol 2-dehydrogenase
MKVLRLHSIGELQLHEEPVPLPGPGEALIRVTAVGICGSDVHWYSESGIGDARLDHPLILGHEFAGVIESETHKGQRVAVDPALPCEKCEYCVQGNPNLCPYVRFAGHGETDGSLREFLTWPIRYTYPLPDTVDDIEGAMLEPLGVAIHAVDLAHLKPGMRVAVIGSGPIGLMILQLVRQSAAIQIIATDRLQHRVASALDFGADLAFVADGITENQLIWDATQGKGVDVAFEVAGENPAIETSVYAAKPGGKVILVGIPSVDETKFTASVARRKGLTVKFVRRMKHVYPRAIELVSKKIIDVRSIVTHTFHLEEAREAFTSAQKREGLKVVIKEFNP